MVEVRVFEIRRLNSDFSPIEDLSFGVDSDATSVQVSEWLATLARRIPDAYFAQLLTFGPAPAAAEAKWEIRRQDGRRAIRMRVRPAAADARASGPVSGSGHTGGERTARALPAGLRSPPHRNRGPGNQAAGADRAGNDPDRQRPQLRDTAQPLPVVVPGARRPRGPGRSFTRVSGIRTSTWRSGSLSGASKVRLRRRPSGYGRRTILGCGSSGRRWSGTRKASCASASTWTKKAP